MSADVRFVPHTAQRDALVLAPQRFGNGLANGGFAHAGRTDEAEDLSLRIRIQRTNGETLQNSLLDLLQAVVIPVQHVGCLFQIHLALAGLIPRQREHGVQIAANDKRLLCALRNSGKTLRLFCQFFSVLFIQRKLLDLFQICFHLRLGVFPISQLFSNQTLLFPQVVVPL